MSTLLRELEVMNELVTVFDGLDKGELRRIIAWLEDYFDVYEEECICADAPESDENIAETAEGLPYDEADNEDHLGSSSEPQDFEDLYNRVSPKTAIQKIVTAAYWLETHDEKDSWKSFEANKLLKSLGIKVSSVSGTLALESKKDIPFVELLAKSGDSMQARKTFRLSDAGVTFVEGRMG